MKSALSGCGLIIVALIVILALWYLLAVVAGTTDDGPTGHTLTSTTTRSIA